MRSSLPSSAADSEDRSLWTSSSAMPNYIKREKPTTYAQVQLGGFQLVRLGFLVLVRGNRKVIGLQTLFLVSFQLTRFLKLHTIRVNVLPIIQIDNTSHLPFHHSNCSSDHPKHECLPPSPHSPPRTKNSSRCYYSILHPQKRGHRHPKGHPPTHYQSLIHLLIYNQIGAFTIGIGHWKSKN